MAENQWDFATGKDLPGFGALDASADDIRKMVAEVFGDGPKPAVEAASEADLGPGRNASKTRVIRGCRAGRPSHPRLEEIAAAPQDQPPPDAAQADAAEDVVQRNKVNVAMQQSNPEVEYETLPTRRPHGRALPQ